VLLAIAGLKGGTGKTTLAVSLAAAAHERGRSVMLVDADPRGDARTWSSYALGHGPPGLALPLGASSNDLRAIALGLDLCVVDCPGGDAARLATVLDAADFCLVPCGPSALDVWPLGATFEEIRQARAHNPSLGAAVVINRCNPSTTLGKTVGTQLAGHGFPLMGTTVRQRVALVEAVGAGLSVTRAVPDSHAAAEVESLLDEVEHLTPMRAAAAHPVQ
jgi:chromosome partitioning protein